MGVIRNYGFMWEREKVDWGRQRVRGHLRGRKARGRRGPVIDIRGRLGIYVLYDRFEQPVQVGQANDIYDRLRQHRRDHLRNRWTHFSWFGFHPVDENNENILEGERVAQIGFDDAKDEVEAVLIQVLEPRLNRQGPRWRNADEYLQEIGTEEEDDDED
jgi:hypothetical protein